jgi:uncharacterized protein YodC (DUF2158 family)
MAGKLCAGDRVRPLKGGPVMEVKGYDHRNQVICSWYASREGWQRRSFPEPALRRVRRSRIPAG